VKPFSEDEIETPHPFVPTNELIAKHRECVRLIESIQAFERRRESLIRGIEGFCGTFPMLRAKYVNDIEIVNRSILRLQKKYERLVENLNVVI